MAAASTRTNWDTESHPAPLSRPPTNQTTNKTQHTSKHTSITRIKNNQPNKTNIKTKQTNRRCFREETFGPLVPLFRFSDDDSAVLMANDTEYGLAAYFYTRDLRRAWTMAERLEYGMVGLVCSWVVGS